MTYRYDAAQKFTFKEDENGFIEAEGVIATAGEKLIYGHGIETISEKALFENMDGWLGLPVTVQHPKDLLTAATTKEHQVGSVTKVWRQDNQLRVKFKLTTKKGIEAVKNGLRGLSAAYRAVMDGMTQVGRTNNHLAICNVGRSPSSGIRSDSRQSYGMTVQDKANHNALNAYRADHKPLSLTSERRMTAQERSNHNLLNGWKK